MAAIDYITDFQLRMDSVPTARLAAAKPAGGVQWARGWGLSLNTKKHGNLGMEVSSQP